MQGGPNLYGPRRLGALNGIRVRGVFSGPVSCHSVIITEEGKAYSWGECSTTNKLIFQTHQNKTTLRYTQKYDFQEISLFQEILLEISCFLP